MVESKEKNEGKLFVQDKEVVIPGQEIAEGMGYLPAYGTYREGEKIVSMRLGLISVSGRLVKVIPLSGKYVPKEGDTVIGVIKDMSFSSWFIDIGHASDAVLSIKEGTTDFVEYGTDISQYYDFGDVVIAKITNVTRKTSIDLTMKGPGLRKVTSGKIIEITSSKVPRVIGRQGSMISMIKEKTNCRIVVGQNGKIWIQGNNSDDEKKATEAIKLIEEKSHMDGLTDEIQAFLDGGKKK